jgi:hypothetical protein
MFIGRLRRKIASLLTLTDPKTVKEAVASTKRIETEIYYNNERSRKSMQKLERN